MKNKLSIIAFVMAILLLISSCGNSSETKNEVTEVKEEQITVRILSTSDMHGYFVPYDYYTGTEVSGGSGANTVSAIEALRNENTIVVDAGDLIQDNCAEIFVNEPVHPMAAVLNAGGYDAWVTGNHEYNYGMEVLQRFIDSVEAPLLTGNVSKDGEPLGKNYIILERGGLKIALIGAVTPNIKAWDAANLEGWDVDNPVDTVKKAISELEGKADILVGVFHMGMENEFNQPGSGVNDIAQACPELDFIISAHDHQAFVAETANGIPVVGNLSHGQTLICTDIQITRLADGSCAVDRIESSVIDTSVYPPSESVVHATEKQDSEAKQEAEKVIGTVEGEALIPPDAASGLCTVALADSPWMQLVADAMRFYCGADICVAFPSMGDNVIPEGSIKNTDINKIYPYSNTMYKLSFTGKQLRSYMEWSANLYNQFATGDLTVSYNPDMRFYSYDVFDGVNYEINISKPSGSRIENLCMPDGSPVEDDTVLTLAVSNYRATSVLLTPGIIFEEGDMPLLLESDVCGNIGAIPQLIREYIKDELKGVIIPYCDNNWCLTGIERDEALYEKALQFIAEGKLTPVISDDGRTPNVCSITEEQVRELLK